MKSVSIEDARKLFFASDAKYVSQEQTSVYYDNFSGQIEIFPYVSHGCLVVKTGPIWHIHALSAEADLITAIDDVKENYDKNSEKIMVCTWNNVPEELKDNAGAYKFVRAYRPYNDGAIRTLTIADEKNIENCCAYDPEDNRFGKDISESFIAHFKDYFDDPDVVNLGLFENNALVGFVQSFSDNYLGLSTINIFVKRGYRKNGYAGRLVAAICAVSKNTMYCYSCVKTNIASVNTAKSCGFKFRGAYLFV